MPTSVKIYRSFRFLSFLSIDRLMISFLLLVSYGLNISSKNFIFFEQIGKDIASFHYLMRLLSILQRNLWRFSVVTIGDEI